VQSYAVDYNDTYPGSVTQTTMAAYVDIFPKNPWGLGATTTNYMTDAGTQGNYAYAKTSTGFTLQGYGKGTAAIISVP
jgi:hypothetical protein